MKITKINLLDPFNSGAWEAFNAKCNANSFYQSVVWAKYLKASKIPFEAFEFFNSNHEKIAQIICWLEPVSWFRKFLFSQNIVKAIHFISPRLCWKDGPVIQNADNNIKNQILLSLLKNIKTNKILSGICSFKFSNEFSPQIKLNVSIYGTFIINLNLSESELYKKLKHNAQKNLKKGNILVRKMEPFETSSYTSLLKKYRSALNLPVPFHACNPILQKVCKTDAFFAHIGAFDNNTLIGALGLVGYREKLIEFGVVRDTNSKYDAVAQDHIKWFIIKNGLKWGFKEFDLAGFNPEDKSAKGLGIRRFKEKWGGEIKEFTHVRRQNVV